ncbi:MAG: prolipoprotein diacylglyceryl transferase family protein, partial [Specibacter sp.]
TSLAPGSKVVTAYLDSAGSPVILGYFQPTFLYESLWCLTAAGLLIYLDKRFRLGAGSVFALYVVLYTAGRFAFELLRSDYANTILGLRVNTWVGGLLLLAGATAFLLWRGRPRSTVEPQPTTSSDYKSATPSTPRRNQ